MNQVPTITGPKKGGESEVRSSAHHLFIFRWFGWRRFVRDFLIMQLGFVLIALSVGIMVNAGLGRLHPWGLLEYAVADALAIDVGSGFLLITLAALLVAALLREPFGWGTIASFIFVTFVWVDVAEQLVPTLTGGIALQIVYVLLAVLTMAFGSAIYLSVAAGAGPRDSIWLAIARLLRVNVGVARTILEVSLVVIGLLLGQSIGLVTLIYALTVGPAIWVAFHLLRITREAEFWGRTPQPQAVPAM